MITQIFINGKGGRLPEKAHESDVGWDLFIAESKYIQPATHEILTTKLVVIPPEGYYFQVSLRSSMAKRNLFLGNAPGIIDPNYRGEIMIPMYNANHFTQQILEGERVAQMVLMKHHNCTLKTIRHLDLATDRSTGGFGSSGK